jgi:hypothetical protein
MLAHIGEIGAESESYGFQPILGATIFFDVSTTFRRNSCSLIVFVYPICLALCSLISDARKKLPARSSCVVDEVPPAADRNSILPRTASTWLVSSDASAAGRSSERPVKNLFRAGRYCALR